MFKHLRHPFGQAVAILGAAYLLFKFGIARIPPLFGLASAPAPSSVVFEYMVIVLVGVLLYVSSNETMWTEFKGTIHRIIVMPENRLGRGVLMVLIPVVVGLVTFDRVRPSLAAPAALRTIHPPPPGQISFEGRLIVLDGLENPLRADGSTSEDYEAGKIVYYENCLPCHGDGLDGAGHYAVGFNPSPLNFQDNGTIAQLTESFVFWRIATGGPGLPSSGAPWNSAMPAWEGILTEDEIWSVIIFIYEQTGWSPRTWEEAGEGEEHASTRPSSGALITVAGGGDSR